MKRSSFLPPAFALILFGGVTVFQLNDSTFAFEDSELSKSLKAKLVTYEAGLPMDNVYVQFDKPFYKPGDDIWFKAYVTNPTTHEASEQSEIVYFELIDPKGNTALTHQVVVINGAAAGDYHIDESMPGGLYKVRAYTHWMRNFGDDNYFEKELLVQAVILPRLLMNLDFEREAYGAGDEVVAKLKLETLENEPLANYDYRFVSQLSGLELASGTGRTTETGKSNITVKLPAELTANDGLLNVIITYRGNSESISRSIPIVLGDIDLQFFPEGGHMVEGVKSRVAFKALNEFGKPADVEGAIIDMTGKQVAIFTSYHMGMGSFEFTPQSGSTYIARITKPEGASREFILPSVRSMGYSMRADANDQAIKLQVNSPVERDMAMIVTMGQRSVFSTAIPALKGATIFDIPTSTFPAGIARITLFDYKGEAQCERLVFVNRDRTLNVKVTTAKEKYLPRELVTLNIETTDEDGLPVPANLSLSVVDDKLIAFADDKSDNILSYTLMSSELKGKVEEPNFYFKKDEPKASKALDFLLMTQGWRGFEWKEVVDESWAARKTAFTYNPEVARIHGIVKRNEATKPVKGTKVTILETQQEVLVGDDGRFEFRGVDISKTTTMKAVTPDGLERTFTVTDYATEYTVMDAVTGTVIDASTGEPLPFVNVQLLGNGATLCAGVSDLNGGFALSLPVGSAIPTALNASMVGYSWTSVPLQNVAEPVTVKMEEQVWELEEVAIVRMAHVDNVQMNVQNVPGVAGGRERKPKGAKQNLRFDMMAMPEPVMVEDAAEEVAMVDEGDGEFVHDLNPDAFFGLADEDLGFKQIPVEPAGPKYYRARSFYSPKYEDQTPPAVRNDFRQTLYWEPNVISGEDGKATITFYNSDEVSQWRATIEGMGDGLVGRTEFTYFTQLPFSMDVKIPEAFTFEDKLTLLVNLRNNTDKAITGRLDIVSPEAFKMGDQVRHEYTVEANSNSIAAVPFEVLRHAGKGKFEVAFTSSGLSDAFEAHVEVMPKGFPVTATLSGQDMKKEFSVSMRDVMPGSIKMTFTAYPNMLADLMDGIDRILQQPYGCFEQTSTSTYPNILALMYMNETGTASADVREKALGYIDAGYERLISFETSEDGYEWFGGAPAHEGLTAYGLMEFNDMQNVYASVDDKMVVRTADYLNKRRDGSGGFKRNDRALDQFGSASQDVQNAYITYALSEVGGTDITKELNKAYDHAMKGNDAYELALVANTCYNVGDSKRGHEALSKFFAQVSDKGLGQLTAAHSITCSGGQSLQIETASLGLLASLKADAKDVKQLKSMADWIVNSRSAYGFGSTQGTILALKALTEYSKFSKQTKSSGRIEILINGTKVGERTYEAGTTGEISVENLGQYLKEGATKVEVRFADTKEPLPYTLDVTYSTYTPNSDAACQVSLATSLNTSRVKVGETARMTAVLKNVTTEGLPMTMAILGIPSGLSAQPWQLKELIDKKKVDFYEVRKNYVILYYRDMAPSEVQTINLDLKAEVPGTYEATASSAYLYYTNEFKYWESGEKVVIE